MSNDTVKQELAKTTTEQMIVRPPTEVMATAAAAQVKAMVEARCVMAVQRPRVMDQVRVDLLKECKRPTFALEDIKGKGNSALYRKPVGGSNSVEGLGIRFAEVAIRCMGNMMNDSFVIQESDETIEKYCFVLDLEKNNSWGDTVKISKTVERREPREGDVIISRRINSKNEPVYLIAATEDALITKEAALVSKKMRTLILRMIPGDLQDECIQTIKEIREKEVVDDPDAVKKRLTDWYAEQNVTVHMLQEFLGKPLGEASPQELVNLQSLYASLSSEETTWAEIMANAEDLRTASGIKTGTTEKKESRGNAAAREKVATTTVEKKAEVQPIVVCSSCGSSDRQLSKTDKGLLCDECKPTTAPAPAGTGGLPWLSNPTTAAGPTVTSEKSEPTIEEKVAQMANDKKQSAAAQQERVRPKKATIKKRQLPEFIDTTGPEDAVTPEQHARLLSAMGKIPGYDTEAKAKVGLENTVIQSLGLPLEKINTEAATVLIDILENWT